MEKTSEEQVLIAFAHGLNGGSGSFVMLKRRLKNRFKNAIYVITFLLTKKVFIKNKRRKNK
jgi:hypothetical protein